MRQSRHLGLLNNKEYIIDRLVTYAANLSNYTGSLTIIVNGKQKEYNFSNADWANLKDEDNQEIKPEDYIQYSLERATNIKELFDSIKNIKPNKSIIQWCYLNKKEEATYTDCSNYCNLVWSLVLGQWIDFPYASRVYNGNIYLLNNKISYFHDGQVDPNAKLLFQSTGSEQDVINAGDVRFVYFGELTEEVGQASNTNLNQHFYTLIGDKNDTLAFKMPTSEYAGAPAIRDRINGSGNVFLGWHYALNIENKNYIRNTGNSSQLDNDYEPTINDLNNFLNNIKTAYNENSVFEATNQNTIDLANSILIYLNLKETVTNEQMINIITTLTKWKQLYNIIKDISDSNELDIKNQLIQKIQDLNS